MTTSKSPPDVIRAQAHRIAETLKKVADGGIINVSDPNGKLKASLEKGVVDFGIVMDDKIVKIEIPWETVRVHTQQSLCDWIFRLMSDIHKNAN